MFRTVIHQTLTWITTCTRSLTYVIILKIFMHAAYTHGRRKHWWVITTYFTRENSQTMCAPDGVRTSGLWISCLTLYQLSSPAPLTFSPVRVTVNVMLHVTSHLCSVSDASESPGWSGHKPPCPYLCSALATENITNKITNHINVWKVKVMLKKKLWPFGPRQVLYNRSRQW